MPNCQIWGLLVCCRKLNNKAIFRECIYSGKLGQSELPHIPIAHREECVSIKLLIALDDTMSQSELTTFQIFITGSEFQTLQDVPSRLHSQQRQTNQNSSAKKCSLSAKTIRK